MKNEKPNVFDKKTMIAILCSAAIFFAWQSYLNKKYPKTVATTPIANPENSASPQAVNVLTLPSGNVDTKNNEISIVKKEETILSFDSSNVSFQVSSQGFGIKKYKIKTFVDHAKNPISLGDDQFGSLFHVEFNGAPLDFEIKEISSGQFEGVATVGEMKIIRNLKFNTLNYSFSSQLQVQNPSPSFFQNGIKLVMPERVHDTKSSSIFFPSFEIQDFVTLVNAKTEVTNLSSASENINKSYVAGKLVSNGSQYFAVAALDLSDILPDIKIASEVNSKKSFAEFVYKPVTANKDFVFNQVFFAGPKSFELLKSINEDLVELIDYGMFGFISKPMLFVMKWFFSLVGNWGLAVILLTLTVRFLVLPLYLLSVRSMKGMQKIQPLMKELQEKHKDDPMRMNKEVWALMKENKASPFGGCLPMLIQIPIFFALYRVIGSSIELYQSPFGLWITDLSSHDRFFILPILMSFAMYFQQKITPTTMDPAQARILQFMPIIFGLFMLSLPSGLTLYMFVSALFGIIQQLILVPRNKELVKAA